MRKQLKKQTKNDVIAVIRERGVWEGYIAGNEVHVCNIWSSWSLGMYVEVTSLEELEEHIKQYMHWADSTLGDHVVFYAI